MTINNIPNVVCGRTDTNTHTNTYIHTHTYLVHYSGISSHSFGCLYNQHMLLTVLCNSSHGGTPVGNFQFGKSTTTQSGKWLCSLLLGPSGLLWYIISTTVPMAHCHCHCHCHHHCHWCWCCCYVRLPFPDCQIAARLLPDCCQIARLPDCLIARSYDQSLTMVCSSFK